MKKVLLLLVAITFLFFFSFLFVRGSCLPGKVELELNGERIRNTVALIGLKRSQWYWFYDRSIVGFERGEELRQKSLYRYTFKRTDKNGSLFLDEGRGTKFYLCLFSEEKKYKLEWNLSPWFRLPDKLSLTVENYAGPSVDNFVSYCLLRDGTADVRLFPKKNREIFLSYLSKLREDFDFLLLDLRTEANDLDLLDDLPFEIVCSETQEMVARSVTSEGYLCVPVPKNGTYDVIFHPDETSWPCLPEDALVPKPLEAMRVDDLRSSSRLGEPRDIVTLECSKDFSVNWKTKILIKR